MYYTFGIDRVVAIDPGAGMLACDAACVRGYGGGCYVLRSGSVAVAKAIARGSLITCVCGRGTG
ncbi:MAG: hypothetical protein U9N36_06260 [Euryarchaeota archaeon]|nr:hypothetical protein [Euryarchaeota archaeon]